MGNYQDSFLKTSKKKFTDEIYEKTIEENARAHGEQLTPEEKEIYKRLNFDPEVKIKLGARVGFICSYPKCGQVTIGPTGENDFKILGEAAHIYGATTTPNSRKVPRPAPQGKDESFIKSYENGIWLCSYHHKLVDAIWSDKEHTPEELIKMKEDAEKKQKEILKEKEHLSITSLFDKIPKALYGGEISVEKFTLQEWALILYVYVRSYEVLYPDLTFDNYTSWVHQNGIKPESVGLKKDYTHDKEPWTFKNLEQLFNNLSNIIIFCEDEEGSIKKGDLFDDLISQLQSIDKHFATKMIQEMKAHL